MVWKGFQAWYGIPPGRGGHVGLTWMDVSSQLEIFSEMGNDMLIRNSTFWGSADGRINLPNCILLVSWDARYNGTWGAAVISMFDILFDIKFYMRGCEEKVSLVCLFLNPFFCM